MSGKTGIEWCDATFNPWWGCERVSPACAHCYADTFARRLGMDDLWTKRGDHGFRFFGDKHWAQPLRWARTLPEKLGRRPRVFCASMADVFEDAPELQAHRARLFDLIEATPELDWLILTKRPENISPRGGWMRASYTNRTNRTESGLLANVWLGVSIENSRYTWRADILRQIPAAVRFISAEPLLGSLYPKGDHRGDDADAADREGRQVQALLGEPEGSIHAPRRASVDGEAPRADRARAALDLTGIDWIIIGGESGPGARPFYLEYGREIIAASHSYDRVAVFVKQLGAKPIEKTWAEGPLKLRDRKGGDWDEWPTDLRIREYPTTAVPA